MDLNEAVKVNEIQKDSSGKRKSRKKDPRADGIIQYRKFGSEVVQVFIPWKPNQTHQCLDFENEIEMARVDTEPMKHNCLLCCENYDNEKDLDNHIATFHTSKAPILDMFREQERTNPNSEVMDMTGQFLNKKMYASV